MQKYRVIIAPGVMLALALVLTGCSQPAGSSAPDATFPTTLELQGLVYTRRISITGYEIEALTNAPEYPVTGGLSGNPASTVSSGRIEWGYLDFAVGPLAAAALNWTKADVETRLGVYYSGISVSNDAKFTELELKAGAEFLNREKIEITDNAITEEYVSYWYVTENVTLTGIGKVFNHNILGLNITAEVSVDDLYITLLKGWNVIHTRIVTGVGTTSSATLSQTVGNPPELQWVLGPPQGPWWQ
jgi:hypothetical protein